MTYKTVAYKIEAFGGKDGEYPMGETTTPTATETKQVLDNLLNLVTSPGQVLRLTITTIRQGPDTEQGLAT